MFCAHNQPQSSGSFPNDHAGVNLCGSVSIEKRRDALFVIGSTIHQPRVNAVAVEPHRLPRHAAPLGVAGLKAGGAPRPWQVRNRRNTGHSGAPNLRRGCAACYAC